MIFVLHNKLTQKAAIRTTSATDPWRAQVFAILFLQASPQCLLQRSPDARTIGFASTK
jgi:hypothetical protein